MYQCIIDSINRQYQCIINKKVSKRLYFLRQLKRANVPAAEMICFYCTCIRPIVEYASPVFHYGIPNYLSKDMERIQLRAMRIIFPRTRSRKSYNEAISLSNLGKLEERRQAACDNLFKEIIEDPNHKLCGTIAGFELKYYTFPEDKENL